MIVSDYNKNSVESQKVTLSYPKCSTNLAITVVFDMNDVTKFFWYLKGEKKLW